MMTMRRFLSEYSLKDIWLMIAAAALVMLLVGCAGTDTRSSTGEYIDDSSITARVKTQLIKADDVSAGNINVETFRGEVLLSGFVNSTTEKERAEQVTRSVGGVKSVSNRLIVKGSG